jgi:hypothetical protein
MSWFTFYLFSVFFQIHSNFSSCCLSSLSLFFVVIFSFFSFAQSFSIKVFFFLSLHIFFYFVSYILFFTSNSVYISIFLIVSSLFLLTSLLFLSFLLFKSSSPAAFANFSSYFTSPFSTFLLKKNVPLFFYSLFTFLYVFSLDPNHNSIVFAATLVYLKVLT